MKALHRDAWRHILKTPGKFFSMLFMIGLGAFCLVGLGSTGPTMRQTVEALIQKTHTMDLLVTNAYGLEKKDQEILAKTKGIDTLEYGYAIDASLGTTGHDLRLMSLPETLSLPELVEGNLPKKSGEIVLDGQTMELLGLKVGDRLHLGEGTLLGHEEKNLKVNTFVIVGVVESAEFLHNSFFGTGFQGASIDGYAYILPEDFSSTLPHQARLALKATEGLGTGDSQYNEEVLRAKKDIERRLAIRSHERLDDLKEDAQKKLDEGEEKILKAREELKDQEEELASAKASLEEAKKDLAEGRHSLLRKEKEERAKISEGEEKLLVAQETLKKKGEELAQGKEKLQEAKDLWREKQQTYLEAKRAYDEGRGKLEAARERIASEKKRLDEARARLIEESRKVQEAQEKISDGSEKLAEGRQELKAQEERLASAKEEIRQGEAAFKDAKATLEQKKSLLLEAEKKIASGREKLAKEADRIIEARKAIPAMEEGIRQVEAGMEEAERGVESLQKSRQVFAAERDDLKAQIGSLEIRLQDQTLTPEERTALEGQLAPLKAQETSLLEKIKEIDQGILAAQKKRSELEEKRVALTGRLSAARAGIAQYEAMEKELFAAEEKLAKGKSAMEQAQKTLSKKESTLEEGRATLEAGTQKLQEAKAELLRKEGELQASKRQLDEGKRALQKGRQEFQEGESAFLKGKEELEEKTQELSRAKGDLDEGKEKLDEGEKTLEEKHRELAKGEGSLEAGRKALGGEEATLEDAKDRLEAGLQDGRARLHASEATFYAHQKEYEEGRNTFEQEKDQAEQTLLEKEKDLHDSKEKMRLLRAPVTSILTRSELGGIHYYIGSAHRMDLLTGAFPAFFFAVALFVASNGMRRMVEEERMILGTLKSLGYATKDLMKKPLLYGGLAALLGSILGAAVGQWVLPERIARTYGFGTILHDYKLFVSAPLWILTILLGVFLVGILASLIAWAMAKEETVKLLRPRPPKNGRRVFLENTSLWKHFSFFRKVSIRNLMRYRGRAIMTLLGVSGCMALLVLGFGLHSAVKGISLLQYEDLTRFDAILLQEKALNEKDAKEVEDLLQKDEHILHRAEARVESLIVAVPKHPDQRLVVIIPEDVKDLETMVSLRAPRGKDLPLTDEGALVTEKLANLLGVAPGDDLYVDDEEGSHRIPVAGVIEGYAGHFLYMTPLGYEGAFHQVYEKNAHFVELHQGVDAEAFCGNYISHESVLGGLTFKGMENIIDGLVNSLDMIVVIMVAASALLAVVVLYNLVTINLEERRRELATIEVLGLTVQELTSYLYRETWVLTGAGIVLGAILGRFLHKTILLITAPEDAMLYPGLGVKNFLYPALVTFFVSLVVRMIAKRKLSRVAMTEALKAVE